MGGQTWLIVEEVRRAKAFSLAGHATIPAYELYPDGRHGPLLQVPIDSLLSPKDVIDMSTNIDADRFWQIWNAVQSGMSHTLQPIVVQRGSIGTRMEDVGWQM